MPGPAFASNGEFETWNFGSIGTNLEHIIENGKVYMVVHSAENRVHFWYDMVDRKTAKAIDPNILKAKYAHRELENWPYWNNVGSWQGLTNHMQKQAQSVGLMIYRENGYASLCSTSKTGMVLTKALKLNSKSKVTINALTQNAGIIKVEVTDMSGNGIDGYSGDDATIFQGNSTCQPLFWNKGLIKEIVLSEFRLKITLDRAEIFALNWN
jgi:hypothetical protein